MKLAITKLAPAFLAGCLMSASSSANDAEMLLVDGHNDLFIRYMDCPSCRCGLEAYDVSGRTVGETA